MAHCGQCPSLARPAVPSAAPSPAWGVNVLCTSRTAHPLLFHLGLQGIKILLPSWKIFANLLMKVNFPIKNRVRNKTGLKPEKESDKDVWLFSTEVNSRNSEENYFFI